ncbi:hypothetical protein evm_014402, partial [Chilo suppressalis]
EVRIDENGKSESSLPLVEQWGMEREHSTKRRRTNGENWRKRVDDTPWPTGQRPKCPAGQMAGGDEIRAGYSSRRLNKGCEERYIEDSNGIYPANWWRWEIVGVRVPWSRQPKKEKKKREKKVLHPSSMTTETRMRKKRDTTIKRQRMSLRSTDHEGRSGVKRGTSSCGPHRTKRVLRTAQIAAPYARRMSARAKCGNVANQCDVMAEQRSRNAGRTGLQRAFHLLSRMDGRGGGPVAHHGPGRWVAIVQGSLVSIDDPMEMGSINQCSESEGSRMNHIITRNDWLLNGNEQWVQRIVQRTTVVPVGRSANLTERCGIKKVGVRNATEIRAMEGSKVNECMLDKQEGTRTIRRTGQVENESCGNEKKGAPRQCMEKWVEHNAVTESMGVGSGVEEDAKSNSREKSIEHRHRMNGYARANHRRGEEVPKKARRGRRVVRNNGDAKRAKCLNWKGRGYKTILDVLLNRYPDPSKEVPVEILLNKEVDSIRWGTHQFGNDSSNPLVHVSCKDGSLFMAKSVIITVSLGVLKERHQELFKPPLPTNKITAINNLELCILDKIYVEFTEAWWSKSTAQFNILWRDQDKAKFSDMKWVTLIFGANTVANQPNVLLFWLYGVGAKEMEQVSQEDVEKGIGMLLKMFMENFDVTPVKKALRSQWASDPLVRGAYSYRSVSTEMNGGSATDLSEPLYHDGSFPVVCFAGEATSHHRHNSVHGAVEAGFREADRLIESFKKL